MGKSSKNGPFSMAMLNNQMVNVNDTVAGVIIHQTNPTYLF